MLNEPAIGKTFFGREAILRTLNKRVNALKVGYRQNVALTGQMLSGKTSILYQFLYSLNDTHIIPVYIEIVEETFAAFADKFIATLLYNYLISSGRDAKNDLKHLLSSSEPLIPHTTYAIKKIKNDLSKKRNDDAYRKLLNLTSILKEETGKSCVVILDEFHNLEFFKVKKPYLHFGKIIMIQKDTMYIVSSSQKSTIKKILSEKLALLYGNFEIIEVTGFDSKTAQAFLKEKLQNIQIPEGYSEYIIDFTDGNPFYIDVISKKIVEIANSRKLLSIDRETLTEAFSELLYNASGTINQYFTNNILNLLEKGLREDFLDLLIALAHGFNKSADMAKWFNKKNKSGFTNRLSKLIQLDMIYKSGVFYEIQDKVFKFWLKTVYHKKRSALVDDVIKMCDDFKREVSDDISAYLAESQKNISERLTDLFLSFNGETVEIERKIRKLPRFVKIEAREYGKSADLLMYQGDDKYWVYEVCREKIDEFVVSELIERCYPLREKISKKIFIPLGGIETNALLLAKEKKVWVWDLQNVNRLLRFYKKHNIVYR
ncbi:MAG: ATP-binding protein [Candidatus Omnitrophica bacterium]|nr:ATP-binding protein [Candidatus Omnitrophota bacterium]